MPTRSNITSKCTPANASNIEANQAQIALQAVERVNNGLPVTPVKKSSQPLSDKAVANQHRQKQSFDFVGIAG